MSAEKDKGFELQPMDDGEALKYTEFFSWGSDLYG